MASLSLASHGPQAVVQRLELPSLAQAPERPVDVDPRRERARPPPGASRSHDETDGIQYSSTFVLRRLAAPRGAEQVLRQGSLRILKARWIARAVAGVAMRGLVAVSRRTPRDARRLGFHLRALLPPQPHPNQPSRSQPFARGTQANLSPRRRYETMRQLFQRVTRTFEARAPSPPDHPLPAPAACLPGFFGSPGVNSDS